MHHPTSPLARFPVLLLALGVASAGCNASVLYPGAHHSSDDDDGADIFDDDDAMGDDDDVSLPPTDIRPEPVYPVDVEDEICDEASASSETYFMSADDSNSQATPVQLRTLVESGYVPGAMTDAGYYPATSFRIHEFLNYYSFDFEAADAGEIRIVPQLRRDPEEPSHYTMGVAAVAPRVEASERRPVDITFSVDTSCSMGGDGIRAVQATMEAVAASLKEGDTVSIVTWSDSSSRRLEAHAVSGPSDPEVTEVIDSLVTEGSTNLSGGLVAAYELANEVRDYGRLNRVILLSDGGANAGVTDQDLIAQNAEDAEDEGIYLVGVLTPGTGYNDGLMNTITDLGKGAYVFIPDEYEADRMFTGERFLSNLEIAARDVRLSLTLPPAFVIDEFHGEEVSQDPEEVEPQHLAPNDAMLYHMELVDCTTEGSGERLFTFELTWQRIDDGTDRTETVSYTLDELRSASRRELYKADLIIAYAKVFSNDVHDGTINPVLEEIEAALQAYPNDTDLAEMRAVLLGARALL